MISIFSSRLPDRGHVAVVLEPEVRGPGVPLPVTLFVVLLSEEPGPQSGRTSLGSGAGGGDHFDQKFVGRRVGPDRAGIGGRGAVAGCALGAGAGGGVQYAVGALQRIAGTSWKSRRRTDGGIDVSHRGVVGSGLYEDHDVLV